jgi:hypothetical protein
MSERGVTLSTEGATLLHAVGTPLSAQPGPPISRHESPLAVQQHCLHVSAKHAPTGMGEPLGSTQTPASGMQRGSVEHAVRPLG